MSSSFVTLIQDIVSQAKQLKNKYTDQIRASVNYACVFCQTEQEFNNFNKQAQKLGKVIKQTETGPIYLLDNAIETEAGLLKLIKIHTPKNNKNVIGYADFTVENYNKFKNNFIHSPNFNLLVGEGFEMLELFDKDFKVKCYFPDIPLDKDLGVK